MPDATGHDGGGAARLSRLGLDVVQVPGHQDAERLNPRWQRARRDGRPFITGHLAQTLDGRVAAADGTSQWITGEASRRHAHEVRSRVDAIVVGTGTVRADDPRLTARDERGRSLDPAKGGPVRRLDQDILLHLAPTGHPHPQEDHVHRNRH